MAKEHNNIPAMLNSISWQLKRIADALEAKQPPQPKSERDSKVERFLNNLPGDE